MNKNVTQIGSLILHDLLSAITDISKSGSSQLKWNKDVGLTARRLHKIMGSFMHETEC